jgi:hypothetical protein
VLSWVETVSERVRVRVGIVFFLSSPRPAKMLGRRCRVALLAMAASPTEVRKKFES